MEHHEAAAGSLPPVESHYVGIRQGRGHHLLPLAQKFDGTVAVPQLGGLLKAQLLRRAGHLRLELLAHLLKFPLQQAHGLIHRLPVTSLVHAGAAVTVALAHMVVQAGALPADVPRELLMAGGQPQGQPQRVDDALGGAPAAIRPKIARPVLRRAVGQREFGVILFHRQADIRIALVVLQQDVVAGHVPLDKGVLQHQCLELAGDEDGVEAVHLRHHVPRLGGVGGAVLEILAHPVFQLLGLAHVDDPACFIHHQIDARRQWQVVGLLPQLFLCHARRLLA